MPSRSIIAVVVVCWLTANGWLFYQETLPYWHSGEAPPYHIDLTEEISNSLVAWEILQKDRVVGRASSFVERQRDRTYRLSTQLHFDSLRMPLLDIRKISTTYHITADGELLGLAAQFLVRFPLGKDAFEDIELGIDGTVEEGEIMPRLSFNQQPIPLGQAKFPLTGGTNVVNPMQLLNRVPGLTEGRQWRMTLFDPIKAMGKAFPEYKEMFAAAEGMTIPELRAEVMGATLDWGGDAVACYKIEYRKPGEPDPVAATWVRRRDGLVLQQYSSSGLFDLTVRRLPNR